MSLRRFVVLLGIVGALVACAPTPMVVRPASRQAEANLRDQVWPRALAALQTRGCLVTTSDRAGGVIATHMAAVGSKPCGLVLCAAREAWQITIADSGLVIVALHRELRSNVDNQWFPPWDSNAAADVEREQSQLLNEIFP